MASPSSKYPRPFYMDHNLHMIPKLNSNTFNHWKLTMLDFIEANGLIGYIDGTIEPPPQYINTEPAGQMQNPDYTEWKARHDHVKSLITSTIDENFLVQSSLKINTLVTAKELWTYIITNVKRPPRMTHPDRLLLAAERTNFTKYLPLHKAAVEGNMKSLDDILENEPNAVRAIITGASETALMLASQKIGNNAFTKRLISLMTLEDLAIRSSFGWTALVGAAITGDVEVMKLMVEKNPSLPNFRDVYNQLALHLAAYAGQRASVVYLLEVTNQEYFKGLQGLKLVHALISGNFFDICLSLLQRSPELAVIEIAPIESLVYRHSAFLSGAHFNFWQRMIYSYLPSELESLKNCFESEDIENPGEKVVKGSNKRIHLRTLFWRLACSLVPHIKHIQEKKVIHTQALQLLRFMCYEIAKLDGKSARDIIGRPLADAAVMGNVEVVEEILAVFPNALYLVNEKMHSIFHIAIVNRQANVFNLIYQVSTLRHLLLANVDVSSSTALHLVAYLVGGKEIEANLNLRSSGPGAALQMQRELQWFKEVQKLSWPQDQEAQNFSRKTPATIFTETHEMLAKEGEQWMKDRANSGIIIATLIATIVFASAITVPGGTNNETGFPVFSQHQAFLVFAVADALALFMSASSMLMFLGILTARYAVQDFLYSLPKRLIIALITLFLSIIFMMVAFTAILYLVFGDEKRWVLGLVSSLASVPVLLFALLQFNPLLDMISSTYGRGIFGKMGDRVLL